MDSPQAIAAFAALSQPTRLDTFRLLVAAGAEGLAAGQISEHLEVRQNTLSTNLNILVHGGLVRRERQGRSIRYYADFDGLRALLAFLMQDCCGGSPALCEPVIAELACPC